MKLEFGFGLAPQRVGSAVFLPTSRVERAQIDCCRHVLQSLLNALIAAVTLERTSLSEGTGRE